MEGFNLIPQSKNVIIDKDTQKEITPSVSLDRMTADIAPPQTQSTLAGKNKNIKIVSKQNMESIQSHFAENTFFSLALLLFVGTALYNGYLFFDRYVTIQKIQSVSANLEALKSTISLEEVNGFKVMDAKIKSIKSRLAKHVMVTDVFALVNQNMRSSIQLSEYKVEVLDTEVQATYSCLAPSFKDMAEQTEKLFELKRAGTIKSFSLSGLSYEADTKRVRFTIKIQLDKQKFSAENVVFNVPTP